ncbi:hypothetical protein [Pseudoalteromonas sp. T1lg22]|uniref:hypothetical protein n=1 Tax=Pseudoalteromonas sp. T1lg22 TaxID=2077096 RepID=UPI00131A1536|nr:hypothetical protein [Pseudoalteromonas sp. T1lg22]
MKPLKLSLIAASLMALTACGGGGSDNTDSNAGNGGTGTGGNTGATTLTLAEIAAFSYDEQSQHSWPLNVTYDGDASKLTFSATESSGTGIVTASVVNGSVEVALADVQEGMSKNITITVTATDGKLSDSIEVKGSVANVSLVATTEQAKQLAADALAFVSQGADELKWYGTYSADLQYLALDIDAQGKVSLSASYAQAIDSITANAQGIADTVNAALTNSSVSLVDAELESALKAQQSTYDALIPAINTARATLDDANTAYNLPAFDSLSDGSPFRTALFGTGNGAAFEFSAQYAFLDTALYGNDYGCNAE